MILSYTFDVPIHLVREFTVTYCRLEEQNIALPQYQIEKDINCAVKKIQQNGGKHGR